MTRRQPWITVCFIPRLQLPASRIAKTTQNVLPLGYMAEKDWKETKSEKSDFEKRSIKAKGTMGLVFFMS